jgi:hypothetical protein
MSHTMTSDEALAVYLYLQHRPPGGMSEAERNAYSSAWAIICTMALRSISEASIEPLAGFSERGTRANQAPDVDPNLFSPDDAAAVDSQKKSQ